MRLRRGLVAFACVVVACSSTPPPKPETPAGPTAPTAPAAKGDVPRGEFLARLEKAVCENSAACCSQAGAAFDDSVCGARVAKELGWKDVIEKAPHYDPKHAAACLDAVSTLAKKCSSARDDVVRQPECAAMFSAGKKTGEHCEENEDCDPPTAGYAFCWKGATGEAPGRCAVGMPPQLGHACFTPMGTEDKSQLSFSNCNDDPKLRCDPATNKCSLRVKTGGACEQIYECEEGAACVSKACRPLTGAPCKASNNCAERQACTNGKCGPGRKMGEACADMTECAEGACTAVTKRCGPWASMFLCKR